MNQQIIETDETGEARTLTGAGLLGIITTGMYDDSLSMYREYIQNAADAIAGLEDPGDGRVEIGIDVRGRRIVIRDNGPGLSYEDALDRLLPIGRSTKKLGADRGFRGVGRLAGLAFAQTVAFTTRACRDQSVTRITWRSNQLPDLTSSTSDLQQAIRDCVAVETLSGAEYPEHFFEVEVSGVALHSVGLLLNSDAVREYIGEVCPVPMSPGFPFFEEFEGVFDRAQKPLALNILFEGDSRPVERLYGKSIRLSANREAEFTKFQTVRIPVDGNGEAAIGWIAHSPYLGAIPKEQRIRGIRARVGNIQIGGEAVFDHLFTEERFNRWCVGELHILDPRIVPNARRDYFQPGPPLQDLENQLKPILRGISTRCRRESTTRNRDRKALLSLCNIEDLHALATSGYLTMEDSTRLVQGALQEVEEVRQSIHKGNLENGSSERLETVAEQLSRFSGEVELQRFGDMTSLEIVAYQRVFGALATLAPTPGSAMDLIESVFDEASRASRVGSGLETGQRTGNHTQVRMALDDAGALIPG